MSQRARRVGKADVERDELPETGGTSRISRTSWIIVAAGILLVAAALRLWDLTLAPFHHDEGVSGWFVTQLLRTGTWAYNPGVYFGPTPYYAGLGSAILFGLNETAMRIIPAFFGLATIGLVLALRRYIGHVGALVAAGLLAVSTGWLYYSRSFFAEELLVCFTVALVYASWRWWESRRTEYLVLGAVSAALLFATKGTSYVAVAVLILSAVCVKVYEHLAIRWGAGVSRFGATSTGPASRRRATTATGSRLSSPRERRSAQAFDEPFLASIGGGQVVISSPALGALMLFAVIYITLFSSFFSNPKGVLDSFGTLAAWSSTATSTHVKPLTQYAEWAGRAEAPILALFVLGAFMAVLGGRFRFALFASFWAGGMFAAYSLIGYKEPWLMLNFVVPMAIVGGYGVDRLWQLWPGRRALLVGFVAALLIFSGYGAIRLSFLDYDNDSNPYVYVQTSRDVLNLLDAVDAAGGDQPRVAVMAPDYWPLPWYTRDNPRAVYFGKVVPTEDPIIVASVSQEAEMAQFASRYTRAGTYTLRPGLDLALYVRNDVATP
jgi:uncharacterized protein (TIGR03663 family)